MSETKRGGLTETSAVERGSCSLTIIPGLPNEVSVMILARLPRALHGSFCRVCRAWREALQPLAVSALRNTHHISEMWILFLLQDKSIALYDPLLRCFSSPTQYIRRPLFVLGTIDSQVFFVGYPRGDPGHPIILCYDIASMWWQPGSIPFWNNASLGGFTSATLDGHLWMVGGGTVDGGKCKTISKAIRLDVKSRRWELMPNMHEERFGAAAVVLQGCLVVIGGVNDNADEVRSGEIWDPRRGEWMLEPELLPAQLFADHGQLQVAVVMDTLYACDANDLEILHYVIASKSWISLGQLPPKEYLCRCGGRKAPMLVGAGKELWVVLNCIMWPDVACRATILSCVPTTSPLLWSNVTITSSVNFPLGRVVLHGSVCV